MTWRFSLIDDAAQAMTDEAPLATDLLPDAYGDFDAPLELPGTTLVCTEPKIGPNDQCPCSSGKKYKKCHGKVVP